MLPLNVKSDLWIAEQKINPIKPNPTQACSADLNISSDYSKFNLTNFWKIDWYIDDKLFQSTSIFDYINFIGTVENEFNVISAYLNVFGARSGLSGTYN